MTRKRIFSSPGVGIGMGAVIGLTAIGIGAVPQALLAQQAAAAPPSSLIRASGALQGGAQITTDPMTGHPVLALAAGGMGFLDVSGAVVDTSQSYTVSAWAKLDDLNSTQGIACIEDKSQSGFTLQYDAGLHTFDFVTRPDPTAWRSRIVGSYLPVKAGQWYHLVAVHDAGAKTAALYLDGALQQTGQTNPAWTAHGDTIIGRGFHDNNPADYFHGEIRDVEVQPGVTVAPGRMAREAAQMGIAPIGRPASVTIDASSPGAPTAPLLYGLMIEDILHSITGGLYAELIQNRDFKDDADKPAHWSPVAGKGASAPTIALDATQPVPHTALTTSLRITTTSASNSGVVNDGFWGIPVQSSTVYRASLYAKAAPGVAGPLTLSLEDASGHVFARATVPVLSPQWKKYSATLRTSAAAPTSENNRFAVRLQSAGTVWLNQVSLFPPTFNNRPNGTRPDIMRMLAAMHPQFLRMPGGNYLEGNDFANYFNWKNTIGDVSQRPGHMDPWGYRVDDGFGLLEYLEWCEDLHMQPILAVFSGYVLSGQHIDAGAKLAPYVQDALDEIEYCTGNASTPWGARRAADGHPAPFAIQYVEIGNEDNFDGSGSYDARFAQFCAAIRTKYPKLKIIATTHVKSVDLPDVVDDHYYQSPQQFELETHLYDDHKPSAPKVFVGEYASQTGGPTPDMDAALGDAAWLIGLERDSRSVILSSYAPLLVNVRGEAIWQPDMIGFDALRVYGSPTYYALCLLSRCHGDRVLPINTSGSPALTADATRDTKAGRIYIKMVNPLGAPLATSVALAGLHPLPAEHADVYTLRGASLGDTNTMADPRHIVPIHSTLPLSGSTLHYTLAPYSITLVSFAAGK